MGKIKTILVSAGFLLLLQANGVKAEDVKIYDQPPSIEELGQALFGDDAANAADTGEGLKLRSLKFNALPPKTTTEAKAPTASMKPIRLRIIFANNSEQIMPESIPMVDSVGKTLAQPKYEDKRLVVEGHTDSAGSDTYNKALSQRRANAVKDYLVKHFSIPSARIQARGMGESKPLPGFSPTDEANRRVQLYSLGLFK